MDPRVAAFVHYYAREGQAHHVQAVCNEVLKRGRANAGLQLWRAYGLLAGGATAEVCCCYMRSIAEAAGLCKREHALSRWQLSVTVIRSHPTAHPHCVALLLTYH